MIHNDHGPETRLENKNNNNNFNSPVQSDNNALSSAYNATTAAEIATKNKTNHNKSNLNKSDAIGTATPPPPPPIVPPPGRPNNSITKQGRGEADSNTNNTNSETCINSSKLDIENQIYTATFYDKSTTNKSKQQPKTCSPVVHQPARTLSKEFLKCRMNDLGSLAFNFFILFESV